MSRSGTIAQMQCPACEYVGMKFIVGDGAADEWKTLRALLKETVHPPDDANIVYCGRCDHVEYVERIEWEKIDKKGVSFDG